MFIPVLKTFSPVQGHKRVVLWTGVLLPVILIHLIYRHGSAFSLTGKKNMVSWIWINIPFIQYFGPNKVVCNIEQDKGSFCCKTLAWQHTATCMRPSCSAGLREVSLCKCENLCWHTKCTVTEWQDWPLAFFLFIESFQSQWQTAFRLSVRPNWVLSVRDGKVLVDRICESC